MFGRMLFSPTSENSIFSARDGKVMVWGTPLEEFDPKCTIPTIEQGGDLVMIWGCFIRQGVGKLCVSWTDFTIEILWNKICNHQSIILN